MRISAPGAHAWSRPCRLALGASEQQQASRASKDAMRREGSALPKRIAFACVALIWLALDQAVKMALLSHEVADVLYESRLGILDVIIVHNTGGAWGMFSDSTLALGVLSLLVCAAILAYALICAGRLPWLSCIGLALVFAGGVGNAIDRFCHGYVLDFLSVAFMDFPVFNIADIGVTVGIALFLVSLFMSAKEVGDGQSGEPRGDA